MQTSEMATDAFDHLRTTTIQASQLMKAMANKDRLLILSLISQGEKSVGELETSLKLHQPSLSQQLTVLREASLVSTRREGKSVFYRISSPAAMAIIQILCDEFHEKTE